MCLYFRVFVSGRGEEWRIKERLNIACLDLTMFAAVL